MNKDEINRAIAEACGYNVEPCTCDRFAWRDADCGGHTPDYFGDLNACHEMETVLGDYPDQYMNILEIICKRDLAKDGPLMFRATAPQRAEAFLRTLGLWQSEPTTPEATRG